MADEWVGIVNTTTPDYAKGASDLTMRRRLILAMLKRKGRTEFNQSGYECRYQAEFSQPPVESAGDSGVVDFSNHDAFRQLVLSWGGYRATDAISMKQKEMNKGTNALINLFQTKQNRLMKSLQNRFNGELFKSGSTAGREDCIDGIETFMGSGTTAAADRIAKPDGSYGGFDTDVRIEGGSWSTALATPPNASIATDWPDGSGDTEYDWLSPKLINWSSTNWGTGLQTWEANCWRVISQAITWLTLTGGDDGMPDICLLAPNLFQGYKNHEEAIRRLSVPHNVANDLGFKGNVLNQDGVAIQTEFDVPANTGYMINLSTVMLSSLFPELWWVKGPTEDPRSGWSHLWGTGFYGQCKWQPKHTAKIYNFA